MIVVIWLLFKFSLCELYSYFHILTVFQVLTTIFKHISYFFSSNFDWYLGPQSFSNRKMPFGYCNTAGQSQMGRR